MRPSSKCLNNSIPKADMTGQRTALIMAGGQGVRMGQPMPKQFLLLDGKPVLMHTLTTFATLEPPVRLVLVLPADQIAYWQTLCEQYRFMVPHAIVEGGTCRFDSVRNGLAAVEEEGLVAIHDGVRPLVTSDLIQRCFVGAERHGSAIPVTPLIESLRQLVGDGSQTVDRTAYRLVQTPQTFKAALIKEAYALTDRNDYTDDAAVYEAMGGSVHLVDGERHNVKITEGADLELAAFYLGQRSRPQP